MKIRLFLLTLISSMSLGVYVSNGNSGRCTHYSNTRVRVSIEQHISLAQRVESAKKFFSYESTTSDLINLENVVNKLAKLEKSSTAFKIKKNTTNSIALASLLFGVINAGAFVYKMFDGKQHDEDEAIMHITFSFIGFLTSTLIDLLKRFIVYHGVESLFLDISKNGWYTKETDKVVSELERMAKDSPEEAWVSNFEIYSRTRKTYSSLALSHDVLSKINDGLIEFGRLMNEI